jgi:hypothetical protein
MSMSFEQLKEASGGYTVGGVLLVRIDGVNVKLATQTRKGFEVTDAGEQFIADHAAGKTAALVAAAGEGAAQAVPVSGEAGAAGVKEAASQVSDERAAAAVAAAHAGAPEKPAIAR